MPTDDDTSPMRRPHLPLSAIRQVSLHRWLLVAAGLAGLAAGLALALPVENVRAKCPPASEGLVNCTLQKSWLPAAMTTIVVAGAFVLVLEFALRLPALYRMVRSGEMFGRRRGLPSPPFKSDQTLVAACWGSTYEEPASLRNPWHGRPRRSDETEQPGPAAERLRPVPLTAAAQARHARGDASGRLPAAPRQTDFERTAAAPIAIAELVPAEAEREVRVAAIALALEMADELAVAGGPRRAA